MWSQPYIPSQPVLRYCLWKAGAGAALLIEGPTQHRLYVLTLAVTSTLGSSFLGRWTDSHPTDLLQGEAQARRLLASSRATEAAGPRCEHSLLSCPL